MVQPEPAPLQTDVPGRVPGSDDPPAGTPTAAGRTAALLEVILCSGFPTQLLIALGLTAVGVAATSADGRLSFGYVVGLSLADAVLLVGLIVYFLHTHHETLHDLAVGSRPLRAEITLGILLTPVMVLTAVGGLLLIGWLAPSLRNVPDNPLQSMLTTPGRALVFGLVAIVAGGVREELQRAFVLRRFEQHLGGGWLGLAVFSVAFGLGHWVQGWDAALMTGTLGAIWGALYLVRGSIIASMVSHAGFNATEILIALTAAGSG